MNFIGIDPDLSTLAIAWVDGYKPIAVRVMRAKRLEDMINCLSFSGGIEGSLLENVYAACVENQDIYMHRKGVDPRDILHVGQVAGAALSMLYRELTTCGTSLTAIYFPLPAVWKGQVDKLPHHKRICAKAGIPESRQIVMGGKEPYISLLPGTVSGDENLNPSDWKHVMDGIGLAQYAAERYMAEMTKQRYLQKARGT